MGAPRGKINVLLGESLAGEIEIEPQEQWKSAKCTLSCEKGVYPLCLTYEGTDYVDIIEIAFN